MRGAVVGEDWRRRAVGEEGRRFGPGARPDAPGLGEGTEGKAPYPRAIGRGRVSGAVGDGVGREVAESVRGVASEVALLAAANMGGGRPLAGAGRRAGGRDVGWQVGVRFIVVRRYPRGARSGGLGCSEKRRVEGAVAAYRGPPLA